VSGVISPAEANKGALASTAALCLSAILFQFRGLIELPPRSAVFRHPFSAAAFVLSVCSASQREPPQAAFLAPSNQID
jgi:hypothetical protein